MILLLAAPMLSSFTTTTAAASAAPAVNAKPQTETKEPNNKDTTGTGGSGGDNNNNNDKTCPEGSSSGSSLSSSGSGSDPNPPCGSGMGCDDIQASVREQHIYSERLGEDNQGLWIRSFLINSQLNKRGWSVSPDTIRQNVTSIIDRPLIIHRTPSGEIDHPQWDTSKSADANYAAQSRSAIGTATVCRHIQ
jgi:hypothetical protein